MSTKEKYDKRILPREKIAQSGALSLSDEELVAVLLGSGSRGIPLNLLSKHVLKILDPRNGALSLKDLTSIHGVGLAKATLILAAFEFARRRIKPHGVKICSARDIYPLVRHWSDRKQEHFISITLDGAHQVIAIRVITVGTLNSSQIHPREVFAEAISDRAAALIVCHNHPSGELIPSQEDLGVTRRLKEAGELLGIKLLDHLIFSISGFLSLSESHGI